MIKCHRTMIQYDKLNVKVKKRKNTNNTIYMTSKIEMKPQRAFTDIPLHQRDIKTRSFYSKKIALFFKTSY